MSPSVHQDGLDNVEEIYFQALAVEEPTERNAFLDHRCGDDAALREHVGRLLNAQAGRGSFLDSQAFAHTAQDEQALIEGPGASIGPYKLLEEIGEGGMGVVYMAEQATPVRRRVALKIIKPGMDTRQVVARFEAERQALSLMEHPGIARVLDAGATDSGRPYFVMELVRGIPITEYCDRERLSIDERLKLVVLVCRAVQHAHQKGVIHRDLKPSNILVTVIDGIAVPKVIDFGVSKATGGALTDLTLFTGFHQFIGTPLYMSPEQAALSGVDVDTRSDVYALGVLLYELLTGATPIEEARLRTAAFDEIRRIVREEDPPRPSARLSTLCDELRSTISDDRRLSPTQLGGTIRGDLDWIVMKAIEKDRQRRYESPSALAADVEHYLAGKPVNACPPTTRYRLAKYVRRHRLLLIATGAIATALVVGLGASVWQAVRATRAERLKDTALQQARRAVDDMYTKVAEEWLADRGTLTDVQRDMLESALAFYENLAGDDNANPKIQYELLRALCRVGAIRHRLGNPDLATKAYLKAVNQSTRLSTQFPEHVEFRVEQIMARACLVILLQGGDRADDVEKQLAMVRAELPTLDANNIRDPSVRERLASALGVLVDGLIREGLIKEAEATNQKALDVWHSLVDQFPKNFTYRSNLAHVYVRQGDRHAWRGSKDGEAEASFREAEVRLSELLEERPDDKMCRSAIARTLTNLGFVLSLQRRHDEALAVQRRALSFAEVLAKAFPNDVSEQGIYSDVLGNLAGAIDATGGGNLGESDGLMLKRHAVVETLADKYQSNIDYAANYLNSLNVLSWRFRKNGRVDEEKRLNELASTRVARIMAQHGSHRKLAANAAETLSRMTAELLEQGNYREAVRCISTYPPAARRFMSYALKPPDNPDDLDGTYYGSEVVEDYRKQAIQLLVPAELLGQCMEGIGRDGNLSLTERATLGEQCTALTTEFQEQGDQAITAWIADLEPNGAEAGVRLAIHGDGVVNDWTDNRNLEDRVPRALKVAWCTVDHLMLQRLTQEAAAQLSNDPAQSAVSLVLSSAPEELRDVDLALQMARRGVELTPDDANARDALGWALFRADQFQECLEFLDPSGHQLIRIMALWKLGRHDEARKAFKHEPALMSDAERRHQEAEDKGLFLFPNVYMDRRLYAEAATMLDSEDKMEASPVAAAPAEHDD